MIQLRRAFLACALSLASACSVVGGAGAPGAEPEITLPGDARRAAGDAGAGEADAGAAKKDGEANANANDAGDGLLGTLSGSCGHVKSELASPDPSLEENLVEFVAGETYERASLSPGGQTLFDTPNAGGSSSESEVLSFEILHACEGATLLKTETQVTYDPDAGPGSITDLLVEIDGKRVGVSVTRAYHPSGIPFPDPEVKALLEKKLEGVLESSARISDDDRWVKQILHVFAATEAQADAVVRVLPTIDSAVRADTIVLLTRTTGGGFVYCDPDPPLGSECP